MIEDQHERGRRDGEFYLASLSDVERELPFHLVGAGCDFFQYPVKLFPGKESWNWKIKKLLSLRGAAFCYTRETSTPITRLLRSVLKVTAIFPPCLKNRKGSDQTSSGNIIR